MLDRCRLIRDRLLEDLPADHPLPRRLFDAYLVRVASISTVQVRNMVATGEAAGLWSRIHRPGPNPSYISLCTDAQPGLPGSQTVPLLQ